MDTEALTANDKRLIALSKETGLEVLTCEDLLRKGWVYKTSLNEPSIWQSPMAGLIGRQKR